VTLRNGQWANRPDPMYDHSHESINLGPNVSHKRKPWYERWWVITLQLLVIAASILCCMYEVGCFDR
jgi:hypothetical protein